jgi:hypothetical protein
MPPIGPLARGAWGGHNAVHAKGSRSGRLELRDACVAARCKGRRGAGGAPRAGAQAHRRRQAADRGGERHRAEDGGTQEAAQGGVSEAEAGARLLRQVPRRQPQHGREDRQGVHRLLLDAVLAQEGLEPQRAGQRSAGAGSAHDPRVVRRGRRLRFNSGHGTACRRVQRSVPPAEVGDTVGVRVPGEEAVPGDPRIREEAPGRPSAGQAVPGALPRTG